MLLWEDVGRRTPGISNGTECIGGVGECGIWRAGCMYVVFTLCAECAELELIWLAPDMVRTWPAAKKFRFCASPVVGGESVM